MKIKNRPDNLFNENLVVNDKSLTLTYSKQANYYLRVFLVLVFITLNTSLQKVLIV